MIELENMCELLGTPHVIIGRYPYCPLDTFNEQYTGSCMGSSRSVMQYKISMSKVYTVKRALE